MNRIKSELFRHETGSYVNFDVLVADKISKDALDGKRILELRISVPISLCENICLLHYNCGYWIKEAPALIETSTYEKIVRSYNDLQFNLAGEDGEVIEFNDFLANIFPIEDEHDEKQLQEFASNLEENIFNTDASNLCVVDLENTDDWDSVHLFTRAFTPVTSPVSLEQDEQLGEIFGQQALQLDLGGSRIYILTKSSLEKFHNAEASVRVSNV